MDEIKLKQCPFCGGEAELVYTTTSTPKPYVKCKFGAMLTPKCEACMYPWMYDTEEEAVEAWNRRADNVS